MRQTIAALLPLALAGCSAMGGAVVVGPDPLEGQGFRGVAHFSGDLDAQALAYSVPLTALIKVHGTGSLTVRAFPPPFITIDGDVDLVVEPVAGHEEEAIAAVLDGSILIRRASVPSGLNPVGTVRRVKAARMAMPHPAQPTTDEPKPPANPPTAASAAPAPVTCCTDPKNCCLPDPD